jgi:ribosome maturation factor RimP
LIRIETIQDLIEEEISSDQFIVVLTVDANNRIYVELDDVTKPTSISDCIAMSRKIEHSLDREVEDFSLEVASPGLNKPFRVFKQYVKNVGRPVKVKKIDGGVVKGTLSEVAEERVVVETREKKRIEGRKAKSWVTEEISIKMEDIKETYVELVF